MNETPNPKSSPEPTRRPAGPAACALRAVLCGAVSLLLAFVLIPLVFAGGVPDPV